MALNNRKDKRDKQELSGLEKAEKVVKIFATLAGAAATGYMAYKANDMMKDMGPGSDTVRDSSRDFSLKPATFDDVAGIDDLRADVEEIVSLIKDLKNSKSSKDENALGELPNGAMLFGDPGCGKTLIARAIAGEADVNILYVKGSDFSSKYGGVGVRIVEELFEEAKKQAPCIVYIDEIDAVASNRDMDVSSFGAHDHANTVAALLTNMNDAGEEHGIFVMAATNRLDSIDPAVMRSGRFDRKYHVPKPSETGREAILKVHAKGKPISDDVDFSDIAALTEDYSGADLKALVNEAGLNARRLNKSEIDMEDMMAGYRRLRDSNDVVAKASTPSFT